MSITFNIDENLPVGISIKFRMWHKRETRFDGVSFCFNEIEKRLYVPFFNSRWIVVVGICIPVESSLKVLRDFKGKSTIVSIANFLFRPELFTTEELRSTWHGSTPLESWVWYDDHTLDTVRRLYPLSSTTSSIAPLQRPLLFFLLWFGESRRRRECFFRRWGF